MGYRPAIRILAKRCKRCGQCVDICPEGLFVQEESHTVPKITRREDCIICGHCVSICPVGAVSHGDFPPEDFLPLSD